MLIRRAVTVIRLLIALFYNPSRAAKFVAIVRRVRNARHVANLTPGWRLICFVACLGLILSSRPILPASIGKSAERSRGLFKQGPPGLNLPDINEVRRLNPGVPKITPPVSAPFASRVEPSATAPPSMVENWPMDLLAQGNRVGMGGEDLLSRNYNWSTPIVSLPGRAGMNLNLGLSLNSLIWTKSGTNIYFNLAKGFPSPGFHLGFPEIGVAFYNTETATGSMLVTMPSGQMFEFRANPALGSNVYEEMGGTHMLLVVKPGVFDYRDTVWTLLLTDGTAYKFKIPTNGNNPKCIEVKDRNGNFISIAYTPFEQISAVTDNTGRIVNYRYDGSNRLIAIAQDWAAGPHNYATFAYDVVTIQTNFLGLDMVGAANGTTVSVLSRMDMPDGKVYAFEYNTYAQVKKIRCYAPSSENPVNFPDDYTLLSYVSYNLTPDGSAGQTDCPRFSSRRDWAKDWDAVPEDGAIRLYDGDGVSWGSVTTPDGTMYKEFFGASGWQRGLTLRTETWSNDSKKKWTESTWANDNQSVPYWLNPRVIETNVYDGATRKRTMMDYADFGSVSEVREYDADATTVLRSTQFEYVRGTAYTANLKRRLTQLVKSKTIKDKNGTLQSKVTFVYDKGGEYLVHQGPPIRHDTANFGPTFVEGRGNLNSVIRWDVTAPDVPAKSFAIETGYNTSGSPIFTRDPLNHKASISYADSFSDSNISRNTFAYPTVTTDPDLKSSAIQYNYYFGAVTRAEDRRGAAVVTNYDSIGRVVEVKNEVNQAHIRYVYAPNHLYTESFATVNDLNSEFHQIMVSDGYGRKRVEGSQHPGSEGGYKAQSYKYDIMGRPVLQSNPTEVTNNWIPTGADHVWVFSSQAYDYQGQPTVSTNQEGITRSISYDGCGCAGVQTVTTTDEVGRRLREFHDILGRVSKKQILNSDGTVFYTTVNTYNARDQVTRVRQFKGAGPAPGDESCPAGLCQETLTNYDGHSRVSFTKRPEQGASGTTYSYYPDDMTRTITDSRRASALFTYNARHLTTNIAYTTPDPADIQNVPDVSYQYDNMGNRTQMTDGAGTVNYVYDGLNRLTSETRYFSELASHNYRYEQTNTPVQTTYQIGYSYNLAGQLKQITTPTGDTVDYTLNGAGEVTKVSGTPRDGVTDYVSNITYRAWGAEKSLSIDFLNYSVSKSYNNRMQVTRIDDQGKLAADYTYTIDGLLSTVQGLNDRRMDRSFSYDYFGRVTGTRSASAAGLGSSEPPQFQQDYDYDEFAHMTLRQGKYWYTNDNTFSATYTNNLASNVTDGGFPRDWQYDAEGNVKSEAQCPPGPPWPCTRRQHNYDAVGREIGFPTDADNFDGDGRLVSHINTSELSPSTQVRGANYYLWSSVLNENMVTILFSGDAAPNSEVRTFYDNFIFVNGQQVAFRRFGCYWFTPNLCSHVVWSVRDPLNVASRGMESEDAHDGIPRDALYVIDPLGVVAQAAHQNEMDAYWAPPNGNPSPDPGNPPIGMYSDFSGSSTTYMGGNPVSGFWGLGCTLDGVSANCEDVLHNIGNGSVQKATIILHGGSADPSVAPIIASFRPNATEVDGQEVRRYHLVPMKAPGNRPLVISTGHPDDPSDYQIISIIQEPEKTIYAKIYEGPAANIFAIAGYLIFGNDGHQGEVDPVDYEGFKSQPIIDSAFRTCRLDQIDWVKLANRNVLLGPDGLSTRNIIPHTWLILPDGNAWGFAPSRNLPWDRGEVQDNTNPDLDRIKYPNDHSREYHVCPTTLKKLEQSIEDHRNGRYTWSNRPGKWPDGMNCTGWAALMLENAGIRPPLPSSTHWLMPWMMR